MEVLHKDEEDPEDLVVQDNHLVVLEVLFDRTFFNDKSEMLCCVSACPNTNTDWQAGSGGPACVLG